jgi:hypothetical protein
MEDKGMNLKHFVGKNQLACMRECCRGEEGQYFRDMIENLKKQIATMPATYETEDLGDDAPVTLHYFHGGSDWYIVERDAGCDDDEEKGIQRQAFGFACLNGDYQNAEWGYIAIDELIGCGVELDLYYKPESKGDVKLRYEKQGDLKQPPHDNLEQWMEDGTCPADGCDEGCYVELDGICPHGKPSVVMSMGLI